MDVAASLTPGYILVLVRRLLDLSLARGAEGREQRTTRRKRRRARRVVAGAS